MTKKILTFLVMLLLCVSCTKNEEKLLENFLNIKKNRETLVSDKNYPVLEIDVLVKLKAYTDSLESGLEILEANIFKDSAKKRIKKYLIDNNQLLKVCSNILVSSKEVKDMGKQCMLGVFDICPLSFSRYQSTQKKIISKLEELLGEDIKETNCGSYTKEKM